MKTTTNLLNRVGESVGRYRWVICSLLFFATTINYLDRAVIGLLKETLTADLHWTESDYGNIIVCFQLAYALSLLFVGRVIDWVGTKLGYGLSLAVWSMAAVLHGFATGTAGFAIARALLGVGESGNFPAANKTVAEWFPQQERALATGLYNSGAMIGAIVAPLLVPWIAIHWGWQWAFILTGAVGFVWLIFWALLYHDPASHKRLSRAEYDYIRTGLTPAELAARAVTGAAAPVTAETAAADAEAADEGSAQENKQHVTWGQLLRRRQTWAFVVGKFMTDPVWWFFLFWLPAFLEAQYGLKGMQVSLPLIVVYALSSIGSIGGGWLPKLFIDRGMGAGRARKRSMLLYALLPLLVLFAQAAGDVNMWYAILIISIACAAHCAFAANLFATVSDMFPKRAVATVTGIGGMGGAVGGILIAKLAGGLFDHYKALGDITVGYGIMFIICATAYIISWGVMQWLAPNFRRVEKL